MTEGPGRTARQESLDPLPPRRLAWIVLGITGLGFAFRVWGLGDESFWHDEAWSWGIVRGGLGQAIWDTMHTDLHPPFYYVILWTWSRLGDSESWLRLPSVLFGVASIPLLFRIGNRWLGWSAGLGASLLLALSPNATYFSQEARSYALLSLEVLVAANLVESRFTGRPVVLGVVLGLIGLTHYIGGLFAAVVALWLLLRKEGKVLAISAGVAAAIFAPWTPYFLRQFGSISAGFWLPSPSPRVLGACLLEWAQYPHFLPYLHVGLAGLALLVGTVGGGWCNRRHRPAVFAGLWAALPIAICLVLSLRYSVFYARSLAYVLPAWFLLSASWPRRLGLVVTGMVAIAFIAGQVMMRVDVQKEDWRGAVAFSQRQSDAPVAFWPGDLELPGRYYLRNRASRPELYALPPDGYETFANQWEHLERILEDRGGPTRLWLFTRHRRKHVGAAEFTRFREHFVPSGIAGEFQGVLVELWNRAPAQGR